MRMFRKIVFWLHLIVGVTVGLGVALLAGTGMLMAFQPQIIDYVEQGEGTAPSANAKRMSVEDLLYKAYDLDNTAAASGILISSDANAPAEILYGKNRRVLLNAYTGEKVGVEATALRGFFQTVEQLHRWLALTGDYRRYGEAVTGAVATGFLGLAISGLVLWFPRKIKWSSIKPVLLFNFKLAGKPRDWNWHNVLGFWTMVPILFITLTGLVMSYTWANNLLFVAVGDKPPAPRVEGGNRAAGPQRQRQEGGAGAPRAAVRPPNYDGVNDSWDMVQSGAKDWTSINLRLGGGRRGGGGGEEASGEEGGANNLAFTINTGNSANPYNRTTVTVNRRSGELVRVEAFADQAPGRAARSLVLPIHRGEILGLPGQIIAFLACVSTLVLIYTGFALSVRRLAAYRRRKTASAATAQDLPPGLIVAPEA